MATLLLFLPITAVFSQVINREFQDAKGRTILLGNSTYERLNEAPFDQWFTDNEDNYTPHEEDIKTLKISISQIDSITVFMGTWCGDSKKEVPRLTKTLKALDFDFNKLKIICVSNTFNNYKQSPENEQAGQNIHRVPTIILHNNDSETGRIVEEPVVSIEKDLLAIINQTYKPNYKSVNIINQYFEEKGFKWVNENEQVVLDALKPVANKYNELTTYGRVLLTSWRIKEAVTALEINAKLFPDDEYAHIHLANTYLILGEYEKTEKCCKKALEINPESEIAVNLMSRVKS